MDLRVYSTAHRSFHPKTYIFEGAPEGGVAFVGSSNLARTALSQGVEWNYRVIPSRDAVGFREVVEGFEALFADPSIVPLDQAWVDAYRSRRPEVTASSTGDRVGAGDDEDALARDESLLVLFAAASLQTRIATGPEAGMRDGTTHILLEKRELIERLVPLVPPPRAQP